MSDEYNRIAEYLEKYTLQGQWNKFVRKIRYWDFIYWLVDQLIALMRLVNGLLRRDSR